MPAPFDQPDSLDLPTVVRRYHAAKRLHLKHFHVSGEYSLVRQMEFQSALDALTAEVERRGGRWDVGRLIYKVDHRGLWIEQMPIAIPEPEEIASHEGQ